MNRGPDGPGARSFWRAPLTPHRRTALGQIAELGKLTPREAQFLRAYIKGTPMDQAYLSVLPAGHKPMTDDNARKSGSRMLKRIREKVDWPRLMESAGLGELRTLREVDARLKATKVEFYQGQIVKDKDGNPLLLEDNGTRMRATELLVDLNGKRKLEISGPGGGPIPVRIIDDIPASEPKP